MPSGQGEVTVLSRQVQAVILDGVDAALPRYRPQHALVDGLGGQLIQVLHRKDAVPVRDDVIALAIVIGQDMFDAFYDSIRIYVSVGVDLIGAVAVLSFDGVFSVSQCSGFGPRISGKC